MESEKRASPVWTPSVRKLCSSHFLIQSSDLNQSPQIFKRTTKIHRSPSLLKTWKHPSWGYPFAPKVQHEWAGKVSPCAPKLPVKSTARRGSSKRREEARRVGQLSLRAFRFGLPVWCEEGGWLVEDMGYKGVARGRVWSHGSSYKIGTGLGFRLALL